MISQIEALFCHSRSKPEGLKMAMVAIAIDLAHDGFGVIILALDKAIVQWCRQKVKEGQSFVSSVAKGRLRALRRLK